jgi:hypothetical protein
MNGGVTVQKTLGNIARLIGRAFQQTFEIAG